MDKTYEYENLHNQIKDSLQDEIVKLNNISLIEECKLLRTELQTELTPEENNALYGKNNPEISDETLRGYIRITRSIRAFIFDNLDTHLLTIEKLADMILCRRRAYERRTKDTTIKGCRN